MVTRFSLLRLMGRLTFDEVVELWWAGQAKAADEQDAYAARVADPDDMAGKSHEYVAAYYAAKPRKESDHDSGHPDPTD